MKFSNVFRSLDYLRENSQQSRAYSLLNNSCSNEEDDGVGEVRSTSTQDMKTDSPFSQNTFLNAVGDLPPEPTNVENFVPPSPEKGMEVHRAQRLDIPLVIGGDSLRFEEPVSGFDYGSSVDRLVVDGSDSPRSQLFLSLHSKVFPDAVHPSRNDLDEKKSSNVKAKPSTGKDAVLPGDGPKQITDGLRFLIVVRNIPY